MLLAPLPFDYATLLDSGDRVRKARKRTGASRIRAGSTRGARIQ